MAGLLRDRPRSVLAAFTIVVGLLLGGVVAPADAASSPVPNGPCPKAGRVVTEGWAQLRCQRSKKGLRWRVIAQGTTYRVEEQGTLEDCAADPSAARLGTQVRIYFADSGEGPCGGQIDPPDSALAPLAGGPAVPDAGRRIAISDAGPHKRILALPGGAYRMFFMTSPWAKTPQGIGSAYSTDGLTFTVEPGLRIPLEAVPGAEALSAGDVVKTKDGRWRMYFSTFTFSPHPPDQTHERVLSAVSQDLLDWTLEAGDRIGGSSAIKGSAEHPAVIRYDDGSVAVFYGRPTPGDYGLHYAWSPDGMTFTAEKMLVEQVLDSAFVLDSGGVYAGFIGRRDNVEQRSYIDRIRLIPTARG